VDVAAATGLAYRCAVRIRRSARDWRVDIGLMTVAAVLGGLFLLGAVTEGPSLTSLELTVDIVAGAVACGALLLLRRQWPVGLALALVVAPFVSAVGVGVAIVAVASLAARRPWRATAMVAGLHMAVVAVVFRFASGDARQYWEIVTTVLTLYVAGVTSGMLVRSQRLLVESLQDRARQAEEEQRLHIEEARHMERERLAREMHDALAHRISLLAVHAGALEIRRTAPAEERHAAEVIRTSAYEALEDLRAAIGMLRDDEGGADGQRPQPVLADLPALVEQSQLAGMRIAFENRIGDLAAIPPSAGRHVYRVVQEGLTNARKHAAGAAVHLVLDADPERRVTVEITNPMPTSTEGTQIPGAGTGLVGLRERMDLVGGRLDHGPTADGDYRLLASLPWAPPSAAVGGGT
jgi:signal transduction histidine kinase